MDRPKTWAYLYALGSAVALLLGINKGADSLLFIALVDGAIGLVVATRAWERL